MIIAQVINASKEFKSGDSVITALKPSNMDLETGKLTLIIGPSGSGKTTLLSLLGWRSDYRWDQDEPAQCPQNGGNTAQ
jgi:ABC-type lipoprotein export system ATPase subunit